MTLGSLFSGIGGMDLGLERAGFEVRWQVEIDPFCRRVLAKHWPNVPRYTDIREIREGDLEPVECIAGGFPCQPVSYCGRRAGRDDERWLWPEFARLVRFLRPRYVLVENTPGLLTAGMGDVLGDLAKLRYDAEWSLLPACALGASHPRERVFIVAQSIGARGNGRRIAEAWPSRPAGPSPRSGPATVRPWTLEPEVCGTAHGVPSRLHRLRGLGNAVAPPVAELVGRRILAHAEATR